MIKTILFLLLAAWLVKAAIDVIVGLLQILIGLVAGLLGAALILVVFLLEILARLWRTALQKT